MCYQVIENLIKEYWISKDLDSVTNEIVQYAIGVLIVKYRENNCSSSFPDNQFPDGLDVIDAAKLIIDAAQKIIDCKFSTKDLEFFYLKK